MTDLDEARALATGKEFDKLEDVWTELVTKENIAPSAYFGITDLVAAQGDIDRAYLLLDILTEHYETHRKHDHALETQKHMLRYRKEDARIRKRLVQIYRKKFGDSMHIEDYLECSGMNTGEPIMKAIQRLEEYLAYDVGKYFFFERYGLGTVTEVRPAKREIIVDFERKKKHFLTIDVAQGLLEPVQEDHFLYKKHKNIEALRSTARSHPVELVVELLKSFHRPLSAPQIKGYLEGIIEKPQLGKLWEKARKRLEKHDNIRISGRTAKTYAFVGSPEDKHNHAIKTFHEAGTRQKYELAEEYAKKFPDVLKALLPSLVKLGNATSSDHPGLALDILMLMHEIDPSVELGYTADDLLRSSSPEVILKEMINHEHQRTTLRILRQRSGEDWPALASKLIFTLGDFRLLDALVEELEYTPVTLDDIYLRILAMPKQYPRQFHWMLKRIASGNLNEYLKPTLIPRLLDSLEYVRGIKATAKAILSLDNFDRLMTQAQSETASRIRDAVGKSTTLNDYEKKNFLRIIEHHFPEFIEEITGIIYTTEKALKRKKAELKHIVSVEIPENKKEIGRAREFGDLSENFEYKAAKEKQDQLFAKVKAIEAELQRTQLIDPGKVRTGSVEIGTAVSLERADHQASVTYRILGRWDTDLTSNVISNEAPLAHAMLGKRVGDEMQIDGVDYVITAIASAF